MRIHLPTNERQRLLDEPIPEFELETYQLAGTDTARGQTLLELDLRAKSSATLLALHRDGEIMAVPAVDFRFQEEDVLVLTGSRQHVAAAARTVVTVGDKS